MSEEQLRALAEELGIPNTRKMSIEQLGYAILDQEAINKSKEPVPEKPKKRGRPKKEKPAEPAPRKEETPAPAPAPKPAPVEQSPALKEN